MPEKPFTPCEYYKEGTCFERQRRVEAYCPTCFERYQILDPLINTRTLVGGITTKRNLFSALLAAGILANPNVGYYLDPIEAAVHLADKLIARLSGKSEPAWSPEAAYQAGRDLAERANELSRRKGSGEES